MLSQKNPRIYLLAIVFCLISILIFSRIVYVQIALQDLGKSISHRTSIKNKDLEAVRGNIYDRWGNLLAGNVEVYEVGVELIHLRDKTEAEKRELASFLSNLTEVEAERVFELINFDYDKDLAVFSTVYKDAPKEMIEEIIEARENNDLYKSIAWTGRLKRQYPEGSLAANILGFYATEGYYGVEEFFENKLASSSQKASIPMSPYQPITIPEIPHGASVMLTIDREIQSRTENILDSAVQENGAASGTIIVMDPRNGEILSMATTPRADLNLPADLILKTYPDINVNGEKIQTPFNRAIMQTYEPGSVFKVITMAAAIDAGVVTPDMPFIDTGYAEIYGAPVQNWDYAAWGPQTMTTCMQHSLNVCLASVAEMLDIPDFYSYLNAFNIDRKTNIDLSGERTYPLLSPQNPTPFGSDINAPKWKEEMLAYHSFGQGVAVTPIRMISSISALANEGRIMAPHIQKAIIQNDKIRYYNPMIVSTPIKPETAKTMTDMLSTSLEVESSVALVEGYRMAGKTGTAEIPTLGGYTESLTNASFVGWGPVDDPEFIVYIWLEKPTSSIWSSVVAAPIFSDVVTELVVLLDIPPDEIRLQMANQ